tara:strand:+ start:146 stop:364 length:219 start_codon:yes stop_codon:yes gene_type:complete
MTETAPDPAANQERLRRSLIELCEEFGMRALVDVIVDIDNENWERKLEPAKRFLEPDSPFIVSFDKATDELR